VVSPNACVNGEATIGRLCYIGANAFVRNVVVHDGATIGAGSVVTKDVAENTVVVGAPARLLHEGKPSHVLTRIPDEKP
jgi:acetyltransferase-like isoleucine patch superfamily enzyme